MPNGILGSFSFDRNGDTTAGAITIYRIVSGKPTILSVPPPQAEPRSLELCRLAFGSLSCGYILLGARDEHVASSSEPVPAAEVDLWVGYRARGHAKNTSSAWITAEGPLAAPSR